MSKHSLVIGCLGALALGAAAGAQAQEPNSSDAAVGPPQLRNFSLEGRRQVVQPPPATPPPPEAPAPAATEPELPTAERPTSERTASTPRRQPPAAAAPSPAPDNPGAYPLDQPVAQLPSPVAPASQAAPATPAPAPAAADRGASYWYYAVPAAALALVGLAMVRRRRRPGAEPLAEKAPVAARPPRPDPVPRPWLELSLKADRASFTDVEAELQFELEIANKGGSAARNLRIDVKMFNGGAEQDNDIGAFFRTAGRETTKLRLPEVAAGVSGLIRGSVAIARHDMRAMRLDERLLFIPVVAVNALYDWGDGRTGQTSKSYVIGRELEQPGAKMGAFRVDQGPRVWRTVSQRPHKLAKRV